MEDLLCYWACSLTPLHLLFSSSLLLFSCTSSSPTLLFLHHLHFSSSSALFPSSPPPTSLFLLLRSSSSFPHSLPSSPHLLLSSTSSSSLGVIMDGYSAPLGGAPAPEEQSMLEGWCLVQSLTLGREGGSLWIVDGGHCDWMSHCFQHADKRLQLLHRSTCRQNSGHVICPPPYVAGRGPVCSGSVHRSAESDNSPTPSSVLMDPPIKLLSSQAGQPTTGGDSGESLSLSVMCNRRHLGLLSWIWEYLRVFVSPGLTECVSFSCNECKCSCKSVWIRNKCGLRTDESKTTGLKISKSNIIYISIISVWSYNQLWGFNQSLQPRLH